MRTQKQQQHLFRWRRLLIKGLLKDSKKRQERIRISVLEKEKAREGGSMGLLSVAALTVRKGTETLSAVRVDGASEVNEPVYSLSKSKAKDSCPEKE